MDKILHADDLPQVTGPPPVAANSMNRENAVAE